MEQRNYKNKQRLLLLTHFPTFPHQREPEHFGLLSNKLMMQHEKFHLTQRFNQSK